jgi:ribosome biogenesis protein ENP2
MLAEWSVPTARSSKCGIEIKYVLFIASWYIILIFQPDTNQLSLHPPSALLQLTPVPGSGLLFGALNAPQLSSWYIPELGPAPKWASLLDNVTEEMAEDLSGVGKGAYADFKFVDKSELDT